MTKFRWWWSWSSDKFENYLEEMAAKGYILGSTGFGMMFLTFDQKEPQNIRYCVDYNNRYTEEYELLLEDDGWLCKGSSSGWRVWAKKFENKRPNLFTDTSSIVERNKRLLKFLFVILMAQLSIAVINYSSISHSTQGLKSPFGSTVAVLYTFVIVMLIYSIIRILGHNKKIRK
jgi:hypothetical protein